MEARLIIRGHGIISLNNSHYGHNFRKKKEVQDQIYRVKRQLLGQKNQVKKIQDNFNPKRNFLRVTYTWAAPWKLFFTKQSTMAQRLGDWSNFPKIYDDLIFNDIFDVDDSQIKRGVVNIIPYPKETSAIVVDISIGDRESLEEAWKSILPECLK